MLLVVGGHSRNIGKTSLACSILAGTPELEWTAVKIAQFGHGICAVDGKECGCAVDDPVHSYSISEERSGSGHADTQRMLAAGAKRVLWARAPQGRLGEAVEALRKRLEGARNVLFESNSALDHFDPDLYLSVLDFRVDDFKDSARRHLGRADAFALPAAGESPWPWFDRSLLEGRSYEVEPPGYCSEELLGFVRERLNVSSPGSSAVHRVVTHKG